MFPLRPVLCHGDQMSEERHASASRAANLSAAREYDPYSAASPSSNTMVTCVLITVSPAATGTAEARAISIIGAGA
ncbi:hypothetical protein SAMN04488245_106182 [Alloyangia pacifica]|nr:hypothetical protein SAMN04488245_106182 [Alloyangia pacifica]